MPELPEVETTRRGLLPRIAGRCIERVVLRETRLRWPVPRALAESMAGLVVSDIRRRGKYLLFDLTPASQAPPGTKGGHLLLHLGMSGRLRVLPADTPARKHDHFDMLVTGGLVMRLTDPRRFGSLHWIDRHPEAHPLLASLGPEPLGETFDGAHLHRAWRARKASVKEMLMNSHVVVGVGNIYASESLHRAGIDPRMAAGRVSRARCDALAVAVRTTLQAAIAAGGSSMRDYVDASGQAGYFQFDWLVYDRTGEPCRGCGAAIREIRQGQRATYFCPRCQKR